MNVPIKSRSEVLTPPVGYVFPFIDKNDMQLKAKLSDGLVVNYTNIDDELKVISLADFTSFEVMPNKTEIASGTVDNITGLSYSINIKPCTIHKMTLRSSQEPENCDVVIDWGDGTVESITDMKFSGHTKGKSYELEHDYSAKMKNNVERFVVKIYGKDYYTFRNNSYKENNLISRIFESDFQVASHVVNFASVCFGAVRLLKIKFPHSSKFIIDAYNLASTFEECSNLKSVMGFEDNPLKINCIVSNIFKGSISLEETDFVIPNGVSSFAGIFNGCCNLKSNIESIFPKGGFCLSNINASCAFYNTNKLNGTIPDNLLWNSEKEFNSQYMFSGSGVSSQVPESWGGESSDDVIKPNAENRILQLEEKLNALSQQQFLVL